ncbi:Bardet-Biedl syndrome 12 protein [Solea senegalensis]|uniref:Bardet-Biedl syndrome 12 protein n=1 Tax=Solea senegalensis TaxID=28829 RepID=A0AAV6SIV3_SOLSE|nr:Bardet-Biedl syndrome 12 protein [Solea senegalensis]KAG7517319.1 Bardet-Biedl syndrome 12 protein [Solea senegalensis]
MLGCSVLNLRRHVGLQKLSALAAITHSSLGPNKKYKFIHDDSSGESALVCSCVRVLENLELTCAVGQLVYETLQAHQTVYNSGSGCLLFLAGAWSRAALECLHGGISVSHIISAMSEGIDVCAGVCRKSSISIEGLGEVQPENSTATVPHAVPQASNPPHGTGRCGDQVLNASGQRKIKLSRHFCESRCKNASAASQGKLINIAHVAEGLRHGCVDAMNLVLEVNQMQSQSNQDMNCDVFDITKVVTCVLPGLPEAHACVLAGCVVLLSAEQLSVVHHLQHQLLKVALIRGDLSHAFRHLGFSRPTGMQRVSDHSALESSGREEEWMAHVLALLLNLEVNLILVSGLASEKVIQRCCAHHILVVEKVKASALSAFAAATRGVPVTYATQLSKHCVGTGAKVAMWRDLSGTGRKSSAAVTISTSGNCSLVTVILTSCVQSKLQVLEDQFWACAYRLHHALKDRVVLPGAGLTEMLCVHRLQKQATRLCTERTADSEKSSSPYRSAVLHLMADGLIDYISTVMVNSGRVSKIRATAVVNQHVQDCNGHSDGAATFSKLFSEGDHEGGSFSDGAPDLNLKIYDNLSVKQEAWRKALDLVSLVLQTDAEIITGVESQENLMLL